MVRRLLLPVTIAIVLHAAHVEPDERYMKVENKEITLIYPPEYADQKERIAGVGQDIVDTYAHSYGYPLDSRLYLMLASSRNQIANAFSTQIPLNMQVDYIGGALDADYFATTSWLETLLLHESAHNYQLNAKENPMASAVHRIVGNTPVTWLYFAPVFPLPNLLESSFMLEGNAVLNESLFGNGGRLYSGAFYAMTLTQAMAGYITPDRVYNDHLYFPYGTHHYIVGGFFQLYLAEQYGIDRTNRYFKAFSEQWLPFFTNAVCRRHFGKDFETLLGEYQHFLQQEAKDFHPSEGVRIAFSQKAPVLNSDQKEIFFLVSDARHAPRLVQIEKATGHIRLSGSSLLYGKVFKVDGAFYTRASARARRDAVLIGLYDDSGVLLPQSASKAMQCRMREGQWLYFDIPRSYRMPRLYREGEDLGSVNSSVLCAGDDYYYFKQHESVRTLYRNDTPLLSYHGYYGKVVDVDTRGRVLFVANSKRGSALYRYENSGSIMRVVPGDDILDARLLNDTEVIASVIRADGVEIVRLPLEPVAAGVYEVHYFFEDGGRKVRATDVNLSKPRAYHAIENLHYSALEQYLATSGDGDGVDYQFRVLFADPLEQNHLSVYVSHLDGETIAGAGYDNSASSISYGASLYARLSKDDGINSRGYGYNLYATYPWLMRAYQRSDLRLDWHVDDDRDARSPLSVTLSGSDRRKFGYGFYDNYRDSLKLFYSLDRGDRIWGAGYSGSRDIGYELYLTGGMQYACSDSDRAGRNEHGIWVDNSDVSFFTDPSRFVMPSLSSDLYLKEAMDVQVTLARMFRWGKYSFSLPVSLRQESLYGRFHYFHLRGREGWFDVREYAIGSKVEMLFFHRVPIPVGVEWMYNADIPQTERFRLFIGFQF